MTQPWGFCKKQQKIKYIIIIIVYYAYKCIMNSISLS